jgi:hypothetical protein
MSRTRAPKTPFRRLLWAWFEGRLGVLARATLSPRQLYITARAADPHEHARLVAANGERRFWRRLEIGREEHEALEAFAGLERASKTFRRLARAKAERDRDRL